MSQFHLKIWIRIHDYTRTQHVRIFNWWWPRICFQSFKFRLPQFHPPFLMSCSMSQVFSNSRKILWSKNPNFFAILWHLNKFNHYFCCFVPHHFFMLNINWNRLSTIWCSNKSYLKFPAKSTLHIAYVWIFIFNEDTCMIWYTKTEWPRG